MILLMPVVCRFAGAVLLEIAYGYLDDAYVDMAAEVSAGIFETGGAGSTTVDFFPIRKHNFPDSLAFSNYSR